jgi:hypothetical protein
MRYAARRLTLLRTALVVMICASACCAGCGTRVIVLPPGEPVRLAEPVKATVWVADKDGTEVKVQTTLPAGWWCLADPGE